MFTAWCSCCGLWADQIGPVDAINWYAHHRQGHIVGRYDYRRLVCAVIAEAETALA